MTYHNPVLLEEAVRGLAIRPGGIYVDVTFGGGGHSSAILKELSGGRLIAFDQDSDALVNAPGDTRFVLVRDNFRHLSERLVELHTVPVDGILADLGVSSHQFDTAARGFSIRFEAELDMRMDRRQRLTASDVVNYYPEEELARVFRDYGELHQSRRMAAAVVRERATEFINTSTRLMEVIRGFVPRKDEQSFYARLFQALRIEVNDELSALRELLEQSAAVLRSGGRLVVISYHSLEDRLVKNFINAGNFSGERAKDVFGNPLGLLFRPLTRKPVEAGAEEQAANPRSRSAKMRIAERI